VQVNDVGIPINMSVAV